MKPDGGSAFPSEWQNGISIRDYFAAAALTGNQQWVALVNKRNDPAYAKDSGIEKLAQTVYAIADAMLVERDK